MPDRRTFLTTLAAGILGAISASPTRASRRLDRVGVQLYTVRGDMRRDLDATLERVARIGFREVEFAGYFERTPSQIAQLLRANGLTSPSTHLGLEAIRDGGRKVLDDAKTAGHSWVTVPSLPNDARDGLDAWKRTAATFNMLGERAKNAGLRFAFHNHATEFEKVGDVVPYDLLLAETDPDLVDFQLDVYWMTRAGHDPIAYMQRHPGRFVMTHLKDSTGAPEHRMVDVGAGAIDFPRLLAVAAQTGVQHHFVEHDNPADAFASITSSYNYLAGLDA